MRIQVDWSRVDRLVEEQKVEAAAAEVDDILARAQAARDEEEWTRALVKQVSLRSALHGYETAVRKLKEAPWPEGLLAHSVLDLFYAQSLVRYLQAYSWEIRQRERVESRAEVDLKAWTADQIWAQALMAYDKVWQRRAELGSSPATALGEYIETGSYPMEVRGTLRDALSYLAVEVLADTSNWRAEDSSELARLDLKSLLGISPGPGPAALKLDDAQVHPMVKLVSVLADLEQWHTQAGRKAAALEAHLERLRRLQAGFAEREERLVLAAHLTEHLRPYRQDPWWSMGMSLLAEMTRERGELVAALALAETGQQAYPGSLGGKRCAHIAAAIRAPEVQLAGMASDGIGRRSFEVTHKNLGALHFRAYAIDLDKRIQTARDYNLLPGYQEHRALIGGTPTASWSVTLPPTPDYQLHRTFVTPPMSTPGVYAILASPKADFSETENRVMACNVVLGELVLQTRNDAGQGGGGATVTVLSGESGRPVPGAAVTLYKYDYRTGHHAVATASSDALGETRWQRQERDGSGYFVVARRGHELAIDTTHLSFWPPGREAETRAALVYTDRSIYRPAQTIYWKVIAYRGQGTTGSYQTAPSTSLTVRLVDANGENVAEKTVKTGDFGSAAGEFVIPQGKLLGQWGIQTGPFGGSASVRVEEYKRPTFEVTLKEAQAALRLNRGAELSGEARYYFGQPVTTGKVRWRVVRQVFLPWWWSLWYEPVPQASRVLASGTTELGTDGSFKVSFTPEADEREAKRPGVSYRYQVTAEVTDEGGETRSADRSYRLGFVSVEAQIDVGATFLVAGTPAKVRITRASLDGTPRAGKGSWRLMALKQPAQTVMPAELPPRMPRHDDDASATADSTKKPPTYETPGDRLRPRWNHDYNPAQVMATWDDGAEAARGMMTHDDKGVAETTLGQLAPGVYRLRYETSDDFGTRYETWKDVIVAGQGVAHGALSLPALLLVQQRMVHVGDHARARVLLASGLRDQALMLDRYRAGKLIERRRLVGGAMELLELPIGEEDRGGFSLRLSLVHDHQSIVLDQSIFVPWDHKTLQIEFASFRDRLRPGTKETWKVVVKGAQNKVEAGTAELLAYMYDRSLDVFAPHSAPSLLSLYPARTGASWQRVNLGVAPSQWVLGGELIKLPEYPSLVGPQLKFLAGDAIGGPGRRGPIGGVAMMAMRAAAPAEGAPPPPPASPPAAFAESREAEGKATTLSTADYRAEGSTAATTAPSVPAGAVRQNFAETAFWQPQLRTNQRGEATIEFTVPDSVTAWKVWVHGLTRDLRGGSIERETRTVKELLVRPYLPRFLREGDQAELKVVVNNTSERALSGTLGLEIFDPDSDPDGKHSLRERFGLKTAAQSFNVPAGGSTNVVFAVTAPRQLDGGLVALRVVGKAGELSDGEQRLLPLLPGRLHLAQSRFVSLRDQDRRTMTFADLAKGDDPSLTSERLVVTVDAQLFYTVLKALPYLIEYPYECTEQTLNRFVSTGIVSSLYQSYPAVAEMAKLLAVRETRLETFDAMDPNRKMALEETPWLNEARGGDKLDARLIKVLDPQIARAQRDAALRKLGETQTASGGFPWFPGGPPSPYMTLYLMHGFAKAAEFGVEVPREMVERGWQYLAGHFREEYRKEIDSDKDGSAWTFLTFLNYVASAYPDPSWMGEALTADERVRILKYSFKHWKEHSPYLKGLLALTLYRMDRKDDAKLVLGSVMDSAKTEPDLGTFWAPEDRGWLWYNDTIETHAFALRTLLELAPKDPRREGLVLWLLLNKKLNHWKSTRATAEVLYTLALHLKREGKLGVREEVSVSVGPQKSVFVFEPDKYVGKAQVVVDGAEVDRQAKAMSQITVEKTTPGVAFASATWHFATDRLPTEESGDLFHVSRRYFRREYNDRSREWVLSPLAEGAVLKPGDQVEVQLSLRSKHAAEYVHLRDPRAAGLEPESATSRYKWDLGISWYEEIRDSGSNFFFEQLPAGEYTFKYRLRANLAGHFRVGPATVQSMYAPEFVAYSAGNQMRVSGE